MGILSNLFKHEETATITNNVAPSSTPVASTGILNLNKGDVLDLTKSNPNLTAKIMITFAQCYTKLKRKKSYGAFTIFDLPFDYILSKTKSEYL